MRAIGLVLLSIAISPSAGRARKGGARRRGPAEAGAQSTLGTAARTAAIRRSINAGRRQGRKALVPPQSIFGHAIRDRLHLVRFEALELRPPRPALHHDCQQQSQRSIEEDREQDCERCLGRKASRAYSGDLRKSYLPTPWTIRNRQSLVPRFEVWWACPAFIW